MNKLIEIKNLNKTYYTKLGCVDALKDINLDVKDGEILGIIGNSGCGKSTLLSILSKLDNATSGSIKSSKDNYTFGFMIMLYLV